MYADYPESVDVVGLYGSRVQVFVPLSEESRHVCRHVFDVCVEIVEECADICSVLLHAVEPEDMEQLLAELEERQFFQLFLVCGIFLGQQIVALVFHICHLTAGECVVACGERIFLCQTGSREHVVSAIQIAQGIYDAAHGDRVVESESLIAHDVYVGMAFREIVCQHGYVSV